MKKEIVFIIMHIAYMSIYLARINLSAAGAELTGMEIADTAKLDFREVLFRQ